jgi:ArsR family metal-binding transcriptional regulator
VDSIAMLINAIKLTRTYPCLSEPGKIVVVGEPDAPIDGVLPLLNAILPSVVSYNPMAGVMTVRRQPGLLTLYPQRVTLTQVANVEEALELLAAVRDLLNQTWVQREQIQPRQEGRRTPRPLDVYELLPRTNCRACGEATCMAFAFGLLQGRHRPEACPPLLAPDAAAQLLALQGMAPPDGASGQINLNA